MVSRTERGEFTGMTLASLDRIASALGGSLLVQVRWEGEQLDRLMDSAHARMQETIASLLTSLGWVVHAEVSFNEYGDRGRVDIAAFHPKHRIVLIGEIKSGIGDLQDTLGRLDVKVRLGRRIAATVGWTDVAAVVPALVIGDSRAARRTVADHSTLFMRFQLRGRQAFAWLRHPSGPVPAGLLWFTNRQDSR
jgi:hypothetical protein